MGVARNVLLWASTNRFLAERLPRYRFVKRAVKTFMPGEHLEDALVEARRLHEEGLPTVLTNLGENVADASEADGVRDHYLEVLDTLIGEAIDCQISVKLTQLGLDIDPELCQRHLVTLVEAAARTDNFVWVDIESSPYVEATIDQYKRVRVDHPNIGLCLQAYLYRTEKDLEELLAMDAAIRLVKGAYNEPPDVAFPKKSDVDENYFELARKMLAATGPGRAVPGFATHDEALIRRILAEAGGNGGGDHFEIQMLYGIQSANQRRLAAEGHTVRVLISYGEAWYPWYIRRLAERPANVGFVLRNLFSG